MHLRQNDEQLEDVYCFKYLALKTIKKKWLRMEDVIGMWFIERMRSIKHGERGKVFCAINRELGIRFDGVTI